MYNMVHQNDTLRQYSNVYVPSNIVENDLPAVEPVNPVVTNCELDQGKNEEINTPVVRRSSRSNKGINEKLTAEYELYNVNYCYGCKCKLRASATKTPTSCDLGGGIADFSFATKQSVLQTVTPMNWARIKDD